MIGLVINSVNQGETMMGILVLITIILTIATLGKLSEPTIKD